MKSLYESLVSWFSRPFMGALGVHGLDAADYERRLRELEARSSRWFLP